MSGTIQLGGRDEDKIAQLLYDHVYSKKTVSAGGEEHPITLDEVKKRNYYDLAASLMERSGILPPATDNPAPANREESSWPEKFKETGFDRKGYQSHRYTDVIDHLATESNRRAGQVKYKRHGGSKRSGFTPPLIVDERLLTNLLDWMAENTPKTLELPKTEVQKAAGHVALTAGKAYATRDESLRAAFLEGMGATDSEDRGFVPLFRAAMVETGAVMKGVTMVESKRVFKGSKTLGGVVAEQFGADAGREGDAAVADKSKTLSTRFNKRVEKVVRGTKLKGESDSPAMMLNERDVYLAGFILRESGRLEAAAGKLRLELGDAPPFPEHLRYGAAEAEAPAAAEPVVAQVGKVTMTITPRERTHTRVSELGEPLAINLQKDGESITVNIHLPPDGSVDKLLASVKERTERINEEALGTNVVAQAVRGYVRERGAY